MRTNKNLLIQYCCKNVISEALLVNKILLNYIFLLPFMKFPCKFGCSSKQECVTSSHPSSINV
jgi:hypothetical protein